MNNMKHQTQHNPIQSREKISKMKAVDTNFKQERSIHGQRKIRIINDRHNGALIAR